MSVHWGKRAGHFGWYGLVLFLVGCGPAGKPGSPRPEGEVCLLRLSALRQQVRESPAYARVAARLAQTKRKEQARLDALVRAYRARYALDIRAAKFLAERAKLDRMRGVVLSEAEYQRRAAALEARLRADSDLARAVREQREQTMEYRVRKQNAALEAARIALQARRAQKRLAELASRLEAPLRQQVLQVVARVSKAGLAQGGCRLVCSGKGQVLAARRDIPAVCPDQPRGRDLTPRAKAALARELDRSQGGGP